MIEDSPQMTNAVNNLDHESRLCVSISFEVEPNPYSYVNRIALISGASSQSASTDREVVLLHVGSNAASELYAKYLRFQSHDRLVTVLSDFLAQVDSDDWMRMRRDVTEDGRPSRLRHRFFRRLAEEPSVSRSVEAMLRDASTFEDFHDGVQSEVDALISIATHIGKDVLDRHDVQTFSGREAAIPSHVSALLKQCAAVNVLHVTEERDPIGRSEAQRLLNLKMERGGQNRLKRIQDIVFSLLGVQIDAFSTGG